MWGRIKGAEKEDGVPKLERDTEHKKHKRK